MRRTGDGASTTNLHGLASGLFNTSRRIGGALGLAVLSTLAASDREAERPRRR